MANTPSSMYWQKKAKKREMVLQFDDDDDILKGIETAMRENGIDETNVIEAKGKIKSGLGNYVQGSSYMTKEFKNTEIKIATGHFELKRELFGVLKIIPTDLNSHVTIGKAKAEQGLEMKLSYYEYES
ncbi:MAG: hypothetical protein PHD95_07135 [Candidatus ainarchaeum sp.]|nr:hypothetical protein [Candidatus ainarchaeum sp.]